MTEIAIIEVEAELAFLLARATAAVVYGPRPADAAPSKGNCVVMTFSRAGEANRAAEINHEGLVEALRKETCAVVDVREAGEFAGGHIPGAINLPLSRFDPEELPIDKPVVLVCQSGGRSAKALQRALACGISDICHYRPGTTGWRAQGGPTEGG